MTKDCGHYDDDEDRRRSPIHIILGTILTIIFIILFVILLIYLILRPTKPDFILQDATVFSFNSSNQSPNLLSTTLQVTISTRNPNNRIGVYYQRVAAYAAYHNQQITLPTLLPPTYQGHKDVVVWSPFLYGNAVPVAPYLAQSIQEDRFAGLVVVNVKLDGKIKWKVGNWVSGRYHLWVNCPAYISFGGNNNNGNWNRRGGNNYIAGMGIKYQIASSCHVDVGI